MTVRTITFSIFAISIFLPLPTGCRVREENLDRCVTVHYKQEVNGHDITIRIDSLGYYYGYPAEMHFKNKERGFSITVGNYNDAYLKCPLLPKKHYEIDYEPWLKGGFNDKENFSACPFFFYDIDFDGEDELLVTIWGGGAGNTHAYAVYDGIVEGKPYLKDYPPFSDIDRTIVVDERVQTISLFFDGGNGAYGCEVYKRMDSCPVLDSASFSRPMSEWERSHFRAYYSRPTTDFTLMKVFDEQIDLDTRGVIYHKDIYKQQSEHK